ncbi:hypothetical protein AAEU42_04020 [Pseudoflavonifractor phocaeensis]|uniref:hypothetical protein n=1 Tax=Pseudoflavonifractor phocaeensis TaxID=1870988 RepID=UPI00313D34EF
MMNTTKSEQIRAGLQKSFWSGTSAKASTVCYGYSMASTGNLLICPTEAVIVFHIFDCFILGDSLGKIVAFLVHMGIPPPT